MQNPTAAIIIIGNEILSGRTLDTNTQHIALLLAELGISLREVRTIPDNKQVIIATVNHLRSECDYVFTTGGIGPTHDDITSEAIAEAFGVKWIRNEEIFKIIVKHYQELGEDINPAREKMAFVPEGSKLIYNDATKIPGFVIENVFSLAGIPSIMKSMLNSCVPLLAKGMVVKSKSLVLMIGESKIADQFKQLQNKYPDVDMGSYPFTNDSNYCTTLVLRSQNYEHLEQSYLELKNIFAKYCS